jgi:hypothetical protein
MTRTVLPSAKVAIGPSAFATDIPVAVRVVSLPPGVKSSTRLSQERVNAKSKRFGNLCARILIRVDPLRYPNFDPTYQPEPVSRLRPTSRSVLVISSPNSCYGANEANEANDHDVSAECRTGCDIVPRMGDDSPEETKASPDYERDLGVVEAITMVTRSCPSGVVVASAERALEAIKEGGPDVMKQQAYFVLTALQGWRGDRARQIHRSLTKYLE